LNASGNALLYATYLGGTGNDEGHGVALDASGDVYVVGTTFSNNFPVKNGPQTTFGGSRDIFALKLSTGGNGAADLLYSTYLGGANAGSNASNGSDTGYAIALDAAGNIYVGGETNSPNLTLQNPLPGGGSHKGFGDGFVVKFLGSSAGTVRVSGRVTNLSNGGASFAGVLVTLGGSTNATTTTDASGNYSFTGLPVGGTFTVAFARTNYTFAPPSVTLNNLQADHPNADTAGTINAYAVSGRVTASGGPSNGRSLAGVNVTLSVFNQANSNIQTVTTNADGEYLFDPQPAERNYVVTPAMPVGSAPARLQPRLRHDRQPQRPRHEELHRHAALHHHGPHHRWREPHRRRPDSRLAPVERHDQRQRRVHPFGRARTRTTPSRPRRRA
ncbi:MAG TPA: carboxypeptidase regulatory-like domain-containing protein, partial [Pyrinomonadaceae bacterium]|nr:carboxypeptidase regulatory-like domain-containing protein [Pyrinomonadaceae bacterium]